jgi:hypothetical protein
LLVAGEFWEFKFGKYWKQKYHTCASQVLQNLVFVLGKFDGSFANAASVATLATLASLVSLARVASVATLASLVSLGREG